MTDRTSIARHSVNPRNLMNVPSQTRIAATSEPTSDEMKCVKRERLLRMINELYFNLGQIQNREKHVLCESYRSILKQLKDLISSKSSYNTLKKCEIKLRALSEKIDSSRLPSGRRKRPFITSPDSTEVHIDLTADEDKSASAVALFCYSPTESVQNQPDSTVSEDVLDTRCSEDAAANSYHLDRVSPPDADNEVSSSENVGDPRPVFDKRGAPIGTAGSVDKSSPQQPLINVDEILRDVQKKTGFSKCTTRQQHGKNVKESSSLSKSVTVADPRTSQTVQLIMQLAKTSAVKMFDKTPVPTESKNPSSFGDRSVTSPTGMRANERFTEWMTAPSPALKSVTDEMVDVFSRYSSAAAAAVVANTDVAEDVIDEMTWDENVKSAILDGGGVVETETRDDRSSHTSQNSDGVIAKNDRSFHPRLSIMLEKLMMPNEAKYAPGSREEVAVSGGSAGVECSSNQKGDTGSSAPKNPLPMLTETAPVKKMVAEPGATSSGSAEVGRRNLISKLSQDIGVIHKVGDSHKISPSLKLLKNDLKKPISSSSTGVLATAASSSPILGCIREKSGDEPSVPRDPRSYSVSCRDPRTSALASKRIDPRLENPSIAGTAPAATSTLRLPKSSIDVAVTTANRIPTLLDIAVVPPPLDLLASPFSISRNKLKEYRSNSSISNAKKSVLFSPTNHGNSESKPRGRGRPPLGDTRSDKSSQMKATATSSRKSLATNRAIASGNTNNRRRSSDCSSGGSGGEKKDSSSDTKRVMNDGNDFYSPLSGIYAETMPVVQTGVGYGIQKFKSTFKIPKIGKASDGGDIKKLNELSAASQMDIEELPGVSAAVTAVNASRLDRGEGDNIDRNPSFSVASTYVQSQQLQPEEKLESEFEIKISDLQSLSEKTESVTTVVDGEKNTSATIAHPVASTRAHVPIHRRTNVNINRSSSGAISADYDVDAAHPETADSRTKEIKLETNVSAGKVQTEKQSESRWPRRRKRKEKNQRPVDAIERTCHGTITQRIKSGDRVPGDCVVVADSSDNDEQDDNTVARERLFERSATPTLLLKSSDVMLAVSIDKPMTVANDLHENAAEIRAFAFESNELVNADLSKTVDVGSEMTTNENKTSPECTAKDPRQRQNREMQKTVQSGRKRAGLANIDLFSSTYEWSTNADICDDECGCAYDVLSVCNREESMSPLSQMEAIATGNCLSVAEESVTEKLNVVTNDDDKPNDPCVEETFEKKGRVEDGASVAPTANSVRRNAPAREIEESDGGGDDSDDDLKLLTCLKSIPSLRNALKDTDSKQKGWFPKLISTLDPENLATVQAALKKKQSPAERNDEADPIESVGHSNELTRGLAVVDEKPMVETTVGHARLVSKEKNTCELRGLEVALVSGELEKLASVESVEHIAGDGETDSKQATLTKSRRKRYTNELDRLHADIRKMKRTKNNIFTAIGPRSCTKQLSLYKGRFKDDSTIANTAVTTSTATNSSNDMNYMVVKPKDRSSLPSSRVSSDESSTVDTEEEILLTGRRCRSRKKTGKNAQEVTRTRRKRRMTTTTTTTTTLTTNTTTSESYSDGSSSIERHPSRKTSITTPTTLNKNVKSERYRKDEVYAIEHEQQQQQQRRCRRRKRQQEPQQQRSRLRRQLKEDNNIDTSIVDEAGDEERQRSAASGGTVLPVSTSTIGEGGGSSNSNSNSNSNSSGSGKLKGTYKPCPRSVKLRLYGVAAFTNLNDQLRNCAIVLTQCSVNNISVAAVATAKRKSLDVATDDENRDNIDSSDRNAVENQAGRAINWSGQPEKKARVEKEDVVVANDSINAAVLLTDEAEATSSSLFRFPFLSPSRTISPPPPSLSPQVPPTTPPPPLSPMPSSSLPSIVSEPEGEQRNEEQKKSKKKKKKKKRKEEKVKPLRLTRLNDLVVITAVKDNANESTDPATTRWNCLVSESCGKKKLKKNRESRSSSVEKSLCPRTDCGGGNGLPISVGVDASAEDDGDDAATFADRELRLSRRITSLPTDRNALDKSATVVRIASIRVVQSESQHHSECSKLSYKCVTNGCDYDTNDAKMFAEHLSFLHENVIWNGVCPNCACQSTRIADVAASSADLIDALSHLMSLHMVTKPLQPFEESSPLLAIKKEVSDKRFEVENRSFIEVPIDKKMMIDMGAKEVADRSSSDRPGNDDGSMSSPKLTQAVPRLRVRRLSGDILSGHCDGGPATTESPTSTPFCSEMKCEQGMDTSQLSNKDNDSNASETLSLLIKNVRTVKQRDKILDKNLGSQQGTSLVVDSTVPHRTRDDSDLLHSSRTSTKTPSAAVIEITDTVQISTNDVDSARLFADISIDNDKSDENEDSSSKVRPSNVDADARAGADTGAGAGAGVAADDLKLQLTLNESRLIDLYKCNETYCSFSTSCPDEFCQHLRVQHKLKKRGKKIDPKFLKCLYCLAQCTTVELLVQHLQSIHGFCQYLCPYCVFRACRPVYLLWHLNNKHPEQTKKIFASNESDNRAVVIANSPHKPYQDVVQPFHCTHGCSYSTWSLEEFSNHARTLHSKTHMLKCHKCNQVSFKLDQLLKHYKLHNMAEFQCVYCVAGFPNVDAVKSHLLQHHSSLYPTAIKRRDVPAMISDSMDPCSRYIFNFDFDESLESLAPYVRMVNRGEFSRVTLYRDDDCSGDAFSQLAVFSVTGHVMNNQIMSNMNDRQSQLQLCRNEAAVDDETENAVSTIMMSDSVDEACASADALSRRKSSDSVELDHSARCSDDELSDRLVICESENESDQTIASGDVLKTSGDDIVAASSQKATSSSSSGGRSMQTKRNTSVLQQQQLLQQYVVGLKGKDLYRCVMTGCAVAVEDYNLFKEHLRTCDNARNSKNLVCRHCHREFQTFFGFLNHIHSHGIPRYYCTLCDLKFTTSKKATEHAKATHKVQPTKVIPADPFKNNQDKDIYLVVSDSLTEKNNRKPRVTKNWLPSSADRKDMTNTWKLPTTVSFSSQSAEVLTATVSSTAAASAAPSDATEKRQPVTVVFCLDDVETRWPRHISLLPKEVHCGICNTYSSKVRGNLRIHMKEHSCGLAANDIINPVPRMGKTDDELMFHKMANHAAYSVKTDDKKVKAKDEQLDEEDGKALKVPAFVPKTIRFRCSAPDCTYRSHDAVMLTTHFEKLHPELQQFVCPHCKLVFKIAKINTHLRYHNSKLFKCCCCSFLHYQKTSVEKHQQEAHRSVVYQPVITIRELSLSDVERLEMEARHNYDVPFDSNAIRASTNTSMSSLAAPKVSGWKCNLCRSAAVPTEHQMKSHCQIFHKGCDKRYKCCLCSFARDTKEEITAHLKSCHDFVSQVVVPIYREISERVETLFPPITTCTTLKAGDQTPTPTTGERDWSDTGDSAARFAQYGSHLTLPLERSDAAAIVAADTGSSPVHAGICAGVEEETNNLFVAPFPDGTFKCPFCQQFKSASLEQMRVHIFTERKYYRFTCTKCGMIGVNRQELEPHLLTDRLTHPAKSDDYIRNLTLDVNLEEKVEMALAYQRSKINEQQRLPRSGRMRTAKPPPGSQRPPVTETILISSSSDDENDSSAGVCRPVSTDLNTTPAAAGYGSGSYFANRNLFTSDGPGRSAAGLHFASMTLKLNETHPKTATKRGSIGVVVAGRDTTTTREMFPCPTCLKIYTSHQALTHHLKTTHATVSLTDDYQRQDGNEILANSSAIPCQLRKRSQQTPTPLRELSPSCSAVDESNACRFCNRTLETSLLATEHELVCVKRARRSPNHHDDAAAAMITTTCNGDASSAVNNSAARRSTSSVAAHPFSCVSCSVTAIDSAGHESQQRERFECLHCEKTLPDETRLNHHLDVAAALEASSQPNVECVSLPGKDVHILCPHCRFRSPGSTYTSYLRTRDHLKQAHPELSRTLFKGEVVRVTVDGAGERCLTNNEVAYLQLKDKMRSARRPSFASPPSACSLPLSVRTETSLLSPPSSSVPSRRRRNVAVKSTARLPLNSSPPPTKVILLTSADTDMPSVARIATTP